MGTEKRARQKAGRQERIQAAQAAQQKAQTRSRVASIAGIAVVALALIGLVLFLTRDRDSDVAAGDNPPTTSADGAQIVDRNGEPTETVAPGEAPAAVEPVPAGASITGETPCPQADGGSERTTSFEQAPPMCIDPTKTYTATFDTNQGSFTVALDAAAMPSTVNNFVVLSRYHYYDGTAIFRIDPSLAILQGGAPTNSAQDPGPGYTIPDEGGKFTYEEGDLVMANTGQPNSSGAQYFIATGPEVSALDGQGTYLKFGAITAGLDVAKQIASLFVEFPSTSPMSGLGGGPKEPVIVNSVTITES